MLLSTIACLTCRAIYQARAAAKVVSDPAKAKALTEIAAKLDQVHHLPTSPQVVVAESMMCVLLEEATISAVDSDLRGLLPSEVGSKVDAIVADASAMHAAEIDRLEKLVASKERAMPANPFNPPRIAVAGPTTKQ